MTIAHADVSRKVPFVAVANDGWTRLTSLTDVAVYYSLDGGPATPMTTPGIAALDAANMPGLFALAVDEPGMVTLAAAVEAATLSLHVTASGMVPVDLAVTVQRPALRPATAGRTVAVDENGSVRAVDGNGNTLLASYYAEILQAATNDAVAAAVVAIQAQVAGLNNLSAPDAAAAVWAYVTRTLTSGGGGGDVDPQALRDAMALKLGSDVEVAEGSIDALVLAAATRGWGTLLAGLTPEQIAGIVGISQRYRHFHGDSVPIGGTAVLLPGGAPIDLTGRRVEFCLTELATDPWSAAVVRSTSDPGDGIAIVDAASGTFAIALTAAQLSALVAGRTYHYTLKTRATAGAETIQTGTWEERPAADAGLDPLPQT